MEHKLIPLEIIHISIWIASTMWSDINQTYTTFYSSSSLLKKMFIQSRKLKDIYMNSLNSDLFSLVGRRNLRPFLTMFHFYFMGVLHKLHASDLPWHFIESDTSLFLQEFSRKVHIAKLCLAEHLNISIFLK